MTKNNRVRYLLRRLLVLVFTVWLSASIIFIVPRLAPGDPIQAIITRMSVQAGPIPGGDQLVEEWRERFGLNDPLGVQYLRYMGGLLTFDFGYSLASFPANVNDMVARSLPWTLGLLTLTVVITFLIGNSIGALLAWQKTPRWVRNVLPVSMVFTSVPSILVALILLTIFASSLGWFPITGAYGREVEPGLNLPFIASVIHHGTLPALSIILVSFGYWALSMRGMMITIQGEDYTTLAEAKGLNPLFILYRYMVRNAILPQVTALALTLGTMVSGQVLIESIFAYPGMGNLIYRAIRDQDFTTIQGASYIVILTTALAVFIIDLMYPLIDPRISYGD
ncbi:MAG: ABC transporter permease [Anaerolineae bacterium]|nr:ABC transporter permease [Anaerolineae bacterium]